MVRKLKFWRIIKEKIIMDKNFIYNGVDTGFLYTFDNIETVDRYDKAEKTMNLILVSEETNESMASKITNCVLAMTIFIDEVVGDGTCNTHLGEKTTNSEVLKLKNSIVQYVAQRMTEENTAVQVIPPINRAQRRAKS